MSTAAEAESRRDYSPGHANAPGSPGSRDGVETVESLRKKYYFELDHLRKAGTACLARLEPFLPRDVFLDFKETLNLEVHYVTPPELGHIDPHTPCEKCKTYRINYEKDIREARETITALQAKLSDLKEKQHVGEKTVSELEIMKRLVHDLMEKSPAVADYAATFLANMREAYMEERGCASRSSDMEELAVMQSSVRNIANTTLRSSSAGSSGSRAVGPGGDPFGGFADGTGAGAGGTGAFAGDPSSSFARRVGGGDEGARSGKNCDHRTGSTETGRSGEDCANALADTDGNEDDAQHPSKVGSTQSGQHGNSVLLNLANQQNLLREANDNYERMREKYLAANAQLERLERQQQIPSPKKQCEERRKLEEQRLGERKLALPTIGAGGCVNLKKKEKAEDTEEDARSRPTKKFRYVEPPHKSIRLPLRGLPKDVTLPGVNKQLDVFSFHHGMTWSMPELDANRTMRPNMLQNLPMFPLPLCGSKSREMNDEDVGDPESELYLRKILM